MKGFSQEAYHQKQKECNLIVEGERNLLAEIRLIQREEAHRWGKLHVYFDEAMSVLQASDSSITDVLEFGVNGFLVKMKNH